jgi:TRAP-type C4-dicarboxylate transport system permease small subunit
MEGTMKKMDIIQTILETGTFLSFSAMIITVLLQVITRALFPDKSFVWTEEAARFFFIYAVAFAAPLAMKKQEYVNVDIILNALSANAKKALELIIHAITIIFFSIVFFQAIKFAKLGIGQTSPSMSIPMYISYFSTTIMIVFIIYYAIGNLLKDVVSFKERGDIK